MGMLVCGIPLEFLAAVTFIRGLTGGCTHTGYRNSSLQAIAMDCLFGVSHVSFLQLSHLYVDLPVDALTLVNVTPVCRQLQWVARLRYPP
jgi:hypothetical protein